MASAGALRFSRGAVAGTLATLIALLSHLAGGGLMPEWPGIALPWAASVWVCVMLSTRRLSLIRLGVSVAVSQVLFHYLFLAGTATSSPAVTDARGAGHDHGMSLEHLPALAEHGPHVHGADMWLWHAVGAAVTTGVMFLSERAAMRLREFVLGWLLRRLAPLTLPAVRPRLWQLAASTSRPGWTAALDTSLMGRRGPPQWSLI